VKCPTDGAVLEISERSGVEIDYCPDCRGLWLDRGELDRILERSAVTASPAPPAPPASSPRYDDDRHVPAARWGRDWDDDDDFGRRGDQFRPKKKRGSLLGELLDF
jgi:Zn-finger nucleic acid-binding protein